jgi:hypothetical protein
VRLEQGAEVGEMGGNALAAAPIAICMPAELGLRWSIGTWPLPTARSQPTAKVLNTSSAGDCAVFSAQNAARRRRVALPESIPGERRADRAAAGPGEADDLETVVRPRLQQGLEGAGSEGRLAASALAGDGDLRLARSMVVRRHDTMPTREDPA